MCGRGHRSISPLDSCVHSELRMKYTDTSTAWPTFSLLYLRQACRERHLTREMDRAIPALSWGSIRLGETPAGLFEPLISDRSTGCLVGMTALEDSLCGVEGGSCVYKSVAAMSLEDEELTVHGTVWFKLYMPIHIQMNHIFFIFFLLLT